MPPNTWNYETWLAIYLKFGDLTDMIWEYMHPEEYYVWERDT